jgi:RimJ/RimL family protein N-acetyltransferase
MKELETERLCLRMFQEADLDAYAAMVGDPEVMRYIGDGQPGTRAEAWRHMATLLGHWALRGYGMWAVTERGKGTVIGRVGFIDFEGGRGFEMGWMLAREVWGKGYATEAARAALEWAFGELGRASVMSMIHPDNTASIRVAERLGQRSEGRIREGESDVLVYRIDRASWRAA